ncbi:hypothetical protein STCU_11576 [Strigomonas culicis]|uniref:Uncharacterized protein n=1 Tax=Strigomonas culicis TaxID=28005 RepID=S9TDH9_9TRYP|nr:hypothetical protein STCU_11576 [Strigomonas culicis]|eukprot:EPY16062.1 hypothetical protein STCU_11576 [Strigomonas culicis]
MFTALLGIDPCTPSAEKTGAAVAIQKYAVGDRFWVFRYHSTLFVASRCRTEQEAPHFSLASRTMMAASTLACSKEFGGWGSAQCVPTRDDVYEMLKYVPVHWGNFSSLNVPSAIRKKHLRSASTLMWFRRQPCYFELREINYTTEIRRSIVLHPEAHHMTAEQARELLDLKMFFWEANSLIPLNSDGEPLEERSSFERNVQKFFSRVCPTYFSPLRIILQRYTKKNMTAERLLSVALAAPNEFETLRPKHADETLVRRRGGAGSERWRADFLSDLESLPGDVNSIIDIFNVLTPMWDRPEYVYVRLAPQTQERVKGYDGLLQLLRRHPHLFRVGDHFVCRVDASNPLLLNSQEPAPDDMSVRTGQCEENPYLSPLEIAKVFHYAAPSSEACTVSFLVDAASPAMRAALPPQVITIVQQFPRLFACKENSPGEFLIYKIVSPSTTVVRAPQSVAASEEKQQLHNTCEEVGEADDSWILEEDQFVGKEYSKAQVLEEVYALIPDAGVDFTQLLLWTSLPVQQAANSHFGGLLKMIESRNDMFHITDTPDGQIIYRATS